MSKLSQVNQDNSKNHEKKSNPSNTKTKMVAPQHIAQSLNEVKLMRDEEIPERTGKNLEMSYKVIPTPTFLSRLKRLQTKYTSLL